MIAGIGHNQPPLAERLAVDHAELVKRAQEAADLVPPTLRPITSDEEADAYTETAATLKAVVAEADKAHEPEKAPWLAGGRTVDTFFGFRSVLKSKSALIVGALNAWQTAKLAAQRKADAEAAETARREAELFGEDAPIATPTVTKEAVRIVTGSGSQATGSTEWRGEVIDIAALPRQYMMANQAAIDAAIKGGARDIPGVRIYEAVKTTIRRR